MGDKVVRLVDRVPAPVDGNTGLAEWLHNWTDNLTSGEYGDLASLVVIVERKDGRLAKIAQSVNLLDTTRLIGLLFNAAHRTADGGCGIDRLSED